jgi:hypothetical protein
MLPPLLLLCVCVCGARPATPAFSKILVNFCFSLSSPRSLSLGFVLQKRSLDGRAAAARSLACACSLSLAFFYLF